MSNAIGAAANLAGSVSSPLAGHAPALPSLQARATSLAGRNNQTHSTPISVPRTNTGPVGKPTPIGLRGRLNRVWSSLSPNKKIKDMFAKALQLVINAGLREIYNNEEYKIGKYTLKQILTVAIVNLWDNKLPDNYNLLYNSSKSPCTRGQINHYFDLYNQALSHFDEIYSPLPEEKEQAAVAYSIKEFKKGTKAGDIFEFLKTSEEFYIRVKDANDQKSKVAYKWEMVQIFSNLLAYGFIESNSEWFVIDASSSIPVITAIKDEDRFAEACGVQKREINENFEQEVIDALKNITKDDILLSIDEEVQSLTMAEFLALSPKAEAASASPKAEAASAFGNALPSPVSPAAAAVGGTRKRNGRHSRRHKRRARRTNRASKK